MKKITGQRKRKIITAIKKARKLRDKCQGSVWSNLVKILGEAEAEVAMKNLMWADPGFAPPTRNRNARARANRKAREQAMRDAGLVKVRGAQGGTYWE